MASQSTLGILKTELKSLFRQALAAREMSYMWTHLLPSAKRICDRWIAVQQDGDAVGRWDVYFQQYKLFPRTIEPHGDKQLVASGLSATDAMRLLKQNEENHPGIKYVPRIERWLPTSRHYSRADVVVEDMAQRVSAAKMLKMRGKKSGAGARPGARQ